MNGHHVHHVSTVFESLHPPLNQVFIYGIKPGINPKGLQLDRQQVSRYSDYGTARFQRKGSEK